MKTGIEAWVTAAVDSKSAEKAMVLAGSLRRAYTAKKLVAFTSLAVPKDLRELLNETFDLVLLLEQETLNGWNLEDYARVQALSLVLFKKCVYLSPSIVVLENCDELFERCEAFVVAETSRNDEVDTAVFLYEPSLDYSRALRKGAHDNDNIGGFSKYFGIWLKKNVPLIGKFDEKDYMRLNLKGSSQQSLTEKASIINFADVHPVDLLEKAFQDIGPVEKFAVDYSRTIYMEDVKKVEIDSLKTFNYKAEPIAIVGMSFRLPGGNNVDEFWSLLQEGRQAVVPVPPHRWTKEHTCYPVKNRKIEAGFLNVPIDEIDAKFFGLSPKEAEFLDPQQRLLLEVTWEALEDALIDPTKLRGTQAGVFVGSWVHHYEDMLTHSVDNDFFRSYMGNSIASSAARLSHFLETTGPSIATESGCSSAIAAVDMACKSLRNGDSSFAIAAGVNLLLHAFDKSLMEFVLSPDFRCKTFDASANGFARAEACTVIILKRFSDAVKDGDNIWGLIRGTGLAQEGVSKSLGTPTVHCESLAMELALKDGDVDPREVSYIEAHGTGTAVGDPLEIAAISKAYSKGRTEPLLIGSVKTNVGHTEAASGITGIIKVLLSMKHELIPKHLNLKTLNPNIRLDMVPAQIPLSPVPWPKKEYKRRIAGVSSFGISGTDGHAIIEEPPVLSKPNLEFNQERPLHILKISAKSSESMEELLQKYLTIFKTKIEQNEDTERNFANLAYSANTGRATFNQRAVVIAKSFTQAAKQIQDRSFKHDDVQSGGGKLCFLFTGQGSQYPNMAKQLYETSPVFKSSFDQCNEILQRNYNIQMKKILWSEEENNAEELSRTLYSQTSIFVVEYCLLKLWESWGVKPDFVMGHSLGEFAAAVAAGALHMGDAIKLVAERSRLIDSLPRGKMLVIKANKKTVDETIKAFQEIHTDFWVDYAALNSTEQTVVAGDCAWIEEFSKFCGSKGLKTLVLAATHAFHSRHMDPMLETYRKVASTVRKPEYRDDLPRYISGMEGKMVNVDAIDPDYWVRHTREKVSYMEACRVIQQEGCTLFLEVGPHPVLSALTMRNIDSKITCLPSIRRKEDDWSTILDTLAKIYLSDWKGEIDWKGFDRFYQREKVQLPFYPFNRKPTWARVESIQPKIHSLIGSIMPTASSETIFQNSLTLKQASFVSDHVIGNTVIYPGAGFLEMCLVGGHATVQGLTEDLMKPRRPIVLKSLKISSPMALQDSSVCKLQTVITLNDKHGDDEGEELGYSVGVHRQADTEDGTGGKWIQHASARFLPVAPSLPKNLTKIDIFQIQSSWEKTDSKDFYEGLPEVGLKFGPKFQSLGCGWKSSQCFLAPVKVPEDHQDYLIHPVVGDAMIQSVMLWTSRNKLKRKLQVPVQISEFIWLKEATSSTQFVYCSNGENNDVHCFLVDEVGSPLAYMKGVDFIETTVKLIEGMIQQQSMEMPKLWEDVWKSSRGPMQGYLTHDLPSIDIKEDLYMHNHIPDEELKFYKNLVQLSRHSVLKALYTLGWKPDVGHEFSVESLMRSLKIKKNFQQYIRFFLRSMAKEDCQLLKTTDASESSFKFLKRPPTLEELEIGLKYVTSPLDSTRVEYRLIMEVERNLSKIFSGEVDPLRILFPEDSTKISAAKFYESWWKTLNYTQIYSSKTQEHLRSAEESYSKSLKASECRPTYRVLEIGAGTGVSTKPFLKEIIPAAASNSCDTEYYFTDVSSAFFSSAEKELEEHLKSVVFKKYDMEQDPIEQGLCPGYFDLITATQVLHIAKDIKKTLRNIRSLLKPGGMMLLMETIYPDEKITFIFGTLDGYWQFADSEFRRDHTTLTPAKWEEAMNDSGFSGVSVTRMYKNIYGVISGYASLDLVKDVPSTKLKSWIVFGDGNDDFSDTLCRKFSQINRSCKLMKKQDISEFTEKAINDHFKMTLEDEDNLEGVVYLWSLSPNTRDQKQVSLPFMTLMKLISDMNLSVTVIAIMKGVCTMESSDVIEPTPGAIIGFCKSLANENVHLSATYFDLDPKKEAIDQLDEVFMNLWVEHKQGCAFRDGLRLYPKLTAGKVSRNEPLSLPSACDRFQLQLPKTRLISDLEFVPLEPYALQENEVEIQVKAMALNFRDVFTVLKPIPDFENFNTVGLDFAGVISKVGKNATKFKIGDKVIGMNMGDDISLPSHLKAPENRIVPLPTNMTFAEGVTLPAVLSTAIYCLLNIAKMKKGETVLIHTASGGVGLVAIQLCKYIGVNVIATAGSQRKRTYLRNLGIQHVFHSRTTDFKEEVLKATGGRGVDIVLNSITGPGFKEASLDCLTKGGRFVEMSKLNVWTNEEVKALRPDAFYQLVDLTQLEDHEYISLAEELQRYTEQEIIKPIAYERFDALNIRGALNYLQKAKHIGKIVCIMPEVKLEKSKLVASTPLFNEDSTYLITGGLGGIGFAVAKWMLKNGGKHIALVGRSSPRPEIASQIEAWNKKGYHVKAFSVDVGDKEQFKRLFEELKKSELGFPQLRGVMHAAGVLQDAVLENQSWKKFSKTYNPKVYGSWNLHDLTKDYLLEHFVLFSSVAASIGSPGQTNHSASNAFEDALASYRRSNGLPATSVNWGNWGEVGVATELDFPGIRPISTAQGLLALETFLKTQTSHMTVLNVDSFALALKLFPQVQNYLDDSRLLGDVKTSQITNSDEFWNEVDSVSDQEEKFACFKKFVCTLVRNILRMDPDEPIGDETELQTLGIDSLMMLEMKNGIQNILGSRMTLSANQLQDCNNVKALARTLVDILEGGGHDSTDDNPTDEELKQLIRQDSNLLPKTLSVENLRKKPIREVETVLLTGATGNLGPYLLADLTQRSQVKKVFCLIRSTNKLSGTERLKTRLEQMHLSEGVNMKKVSVIDGDITTPKFGLDDKLYLKLSEDVDAIIHSAVRSDHIVKYKKTPETKKNDVRTVNVLGTLRLLEFAAEKTLKHFFHASTMFAFTGTGLDGQFSESWQALDAFDTVKLVGDSGYVISKHISDQLVYQALLKGIPCKAFRFPLVVGDSKTGRMDYKQNHFILRWLACLKIGAIHDLPYPVITVAVDNCAKISLDIFFNEEAPMDAYNIVQKSLEVEQCLVEVGKSFGIKMDIVSYPEFLKKLKAEGEKSPIAAFVDSYKEKESEFLATFKNPSVPMLKKYLEVGPNFMDTERLAKYAPEYDALIETAHQVLLRDFTCLMNEGVFTKYGIATNKV